MGFVQIYKRTILLYCCFDDRHWLCQDKGERRGIETFGQPPFKCNKIKK